jgi:hypothetical protein
MHFREFILSEAYQVTFYHGTPISNLSKILQNGLKPHRAGTWTRGNEINYGIPSIYFTPSISIAARYAVGANKTAIPVIIEFNLTTPKRFKKVEYDPMDRPEGTWDDDGGYDFSPESEIIHDIRRHIEEFLKKIGINTWVRFPGEDKIGEFGLAALDGFDLYRYILNNIQQANPALLLAHKPEIVQAMRREFPPGAYQEFATITPSGTLRITNSYFTAKDQFRYPKLLPPAAIKAVWVRQKDFPSVKGTTQDVEIELLPGEARDKLETLQSLYRSVMDWAEKWSKQDNADDIIQDAEEKIEELQGEDAEDIVNILQQIIDVLQDDPKADLSEKMEELINTTQNYESDTYGQWGMSMSAEKDTWVHVPRNDPQIRLLLTKREEAV